mgnify:CR=1 FL=1|jgi:hypothetical protein
MSIHILAKSSLVIAASLLVGCSEKVGFDTDVMPILDAFCTSCHSGSGEGVGSFGWNLDG